MGLQGAHRVIPFLGSESDTHKLEFGVSLNHNPSETLGPTFRFGMAWLRILLLPAFQAMSLCGLD